MGITINSRIFKTFIFLTALLELFSFFAFLFYEISPVIFAIVAILFIFVALHKFEYAIFIIFVELCVGSFGRMMVLDILGFGLSIRMVFWFLILAVWVAISIKRHRISFLKSKFFTAYAVLAFVFIFASVFGFVLGNSAPVIFSDANNYLYFALLFPIYEAAKSDKKFFQKFFSVIYASAVWLSLKTIFLFYVFSHELFFAQDILYLWSRKAHLAEITNIDPIILCSRIFIQSQIWLMFLLFAVLGVI